MTDQTAVNIAENAVRGLATHPIVASSLHGAQRKQEMPTYPYTLVTGKLKSLLQKIRSTGIPPKLTTAHLKTLGFTSSNDGGMINVIKFIGLTDGSGIPTPLWSEYRGQHHRAVLGKTLIENSDRPRKARRLNPT